jgi:pyrroloquinoline quinone biosynthesis protein B
MPRMIQYLTNNGPWSQLVALQNIVLIPIVADSLMELTNNVSIAPFLVPHRDEFSETVGFKIITTNKKYLFLPDINKWNIWNRSIVSMVKEVDIALIDGTFGAADELPGRNMSEVPHPFITETMQLFNNENEEVRKKVHFIHFNHTNPAMWDKQIQREIKSKGYQLATQGGRL